ncbi:McrB family protein [Hymenobacter caeli]|uniref:5-methylcytosine-specific restriction protein B n=1 Tax=Hymenobacter caeli TaxID=2735894 RepID=A0ABX2FQK3_9BACT|nr:AAA family ATPase [Hymenobacter caeli]NRT18774.1 5-methylcytosine-specific restriction protein B [Hymenobacter caeli]
MAPPRPKPAEPAAPTAPLTRELVLRALRQIDRAGAALPPSTVYELVYRGRRYPPRAVAEWAHRLATGDAAARWPHPAGTPTNTALEALDFTISTKRPVLAPGHAADAAESADGLYLGGPEPMPVAAEPKAKYAPAGPPPAPYAKAEALAELLISEEELDAALAGLARRRNLLLQGPPGTGKTFLARRLAWLLLGARDESRLELVQFHPSYGYEDFVLGFRPDAQGQFRLVPGVLPLLCQRAAADPARPYVLVIDELNRGQVARIFGELLGLLEADKRGPAHALRLPYAPPDAPRFFVPDNLFVVATLNLADRSLSPLDYALRRRFAVVELRPQFGPRLGALLAAHGVPTALAGRLTARLTALNQTISDDPGLGPEFALGHSYFVPPPGPLPNAAEWLRLVIDQEIAPLLADYWRDEPATAAAQLRKLRGVLE